MEDLFDNLFGAEGRSRRLYDELVQNPDLLRGAMFDVDPTLYPMTWEEFMNRLEFFGSINNATRERYRDLPNFQFDMTGENIANGVRAPPLFPENIELNLGELDEDNEAYYEIVRQDPIIGGLLGNNIEGHIRRIENDRVGKFFRLGIYYYFKMLRYIESPYLFEIMREGQIILFLRNQSLFFQSELIHNFAMTLYVAIQTGRKFAIIASYFPQEQNIRLNMWRAVGVTRNRPRGFESFIDLYENTRDGNRQIRQQYLYDQLKAPYSSIYWYMSLNDRYGNFIERLRGREGFAMAQRRYYGMMEMLNEIELKLMDIYGRGVFNLIINYPRQNAEPPIPYIFGDNPAEDEYLVPTVYEAMFNPDREPIRGILNNILRLEYNSGILGVYLRYFQARHGAVYGFAGYQPAFLGAFIENMRELLDNLDATYRQFGVNYEAEFDYDRLVYYWMNGMFRANTPRDRESLVPFDLDSASLVSLVDLMFRMLYSIYQMTIERYLEENMELYQDHFQLLESFLINFMSEIDHVFFRAKFRVYNNRGDDITEISLENEYEHYTTETFNWRVQIDQYGRELGPYPINLYNFFMIVVDDIMENMIPVYEQWVNSKQYKFEEFFFEFRRAELGGACDKSRATTIQGHRYNSYESKTKNCFFQAYKAHHDLFTFGSGGELTTSLMRAYRRRVNNPNRLITIKDIEGMKLPGLFKVVDSTGKVLYEQGDDYTIMLHEGHYFTPIPFIDCPRCLTRHRLMYNCKSKHAQYKKGDLYKFVRFNKKKFNEYRKVGKMKSLYVDIETFPDEKKKHIPYSIAFYADEGIEWRAHEDLMSMGDGVFFFAGPHCIKKFVEQLMLFNKSKIKIPLICHNGSRYDFILILEEIININQEEISVKDIIYKGGKIMKMNVFNKEECEFVFWDSCLHLLMSLKKACESFNVPAELAKGDFDHEKIRSYEDVVEHFLEWREYLKNDVLCLKYILNIYEDFILENMEVSPFNFVTVSSLANFKIKKDIRDNDLDVYIPQTFEEDDYIRKAIYGGRTQTVKQNFESSGEGDYLIGLDVVSLYPSVMDYEDFFIGEPRKVESGEELQEIMWMYEDNKKIPPGIYFCQVTPPPSERRYPIPFLPYKDDKGILYWQYKECIAHYDSKSIMFAMELGYKFEFISALIWDKTSDQVFKKSNAFWQDLKNKASAEGNEGKRQIAKIGNNSGYGKQIQQNVHEKTLYVKSEDVMLLINQYGSTNVKFFGNYQKPNRIAIVQERAEKPQTPSHLGVMILSASRIHMYKMFLRIMEPYGLNTSIEDCFKHAPYYTDTDSMYIHVSQLPKLQDLIGKKFGQLDYDFKRPDIVIKFARFHAPKTYFYEVIDLQTGEEIKKTKTKGFPEKYVTYDQLKNASLTGQSIEVNFPQIQRLVFNKTIHTECLSLYNIIGRRVLNLSCYTRSLRYYDKEKNQLYFVPFF